MFEALEGHLKMVKQKYEDRQDIAQDLWDMHDIVEEIENTWERVMEDECC